MEYALGTGAASAHPLISYRLPPRGTLRRDLAVSTIDAAAFSVMVGCGETYLPAFALALGLGPIVAGMVASVPLLVGAVVQLVAPLAVRRFGSNRRWVIICVLAQAASFLPLIWWGLKGRAEAWHLLAAASLYWSAGMAAAPAWIAWLAGLVPGRVRTRYVAQRNRMGQLFGFFGFVAAALLLQAGARRDAVLVGFAAVFSLAAAARLVSSICLWACRERRRPAATGIPSLGEAGLAGRMRAGWRELGEGQAGKLVAFLCSFMFGLQVAGPYFTPYMLEALGFSYGQFLVVMATGVLVKAVLLSAIGRLGSRLGHWRLLRFSSLAIVPLSLLWLPSAEVGWLVAVQLLAGTCWAAYELSVALLLFEVAGDRDRGNVIAIYNLGLALATVAGAACGGFLLRHFGETREAYAAVFAASCLARAAAVPLLLRIRSR
jgi:MFS family permease